MGRADIAQTGFAQALARFPESAAALRRLVLSDAEFRNLCEEYALAQESLARFESRPDADKRPEISDYRSIIAELEVEISRYLRQANREA